MLNIFKQPSIYDSSFEQMLTYDIAILTDERIQARIDECREDMKKRGLTSYAPHAVLQKDGTGLELLRLYRVIELRGILHRHGWQQKNSSS